MITRTLAALLLMAATASAQFYNADVHYADSDLLCHTDNRVVLSTGTVVGGPDGDDDDFFLTGQYPPIWRNVSAYFGQVSHQGNTAWSQSDGAGWVVGKSSLAGLNLETQCTRADGVLFPEATAWVSATTKTYWEIDVPPAPLGLYRWKWEVKAKIKDVNLANLLDFQPTLSAVNETSNVINITWNHAQNKWRLQGYITTSANKIGLMPPQYFGGDNPGGYSAISPITCYTFSGNMDTVRWNQWAGTTAAMVMSLNATGSDSQKCEGNIVVKLISVEKVDT